MSALLQKLLKSREVRVEVGGYVFHAHRPTPLQRAKWDETGGAAYGCIDLIFNWENVTEQALTGHGDPHPLPFDKAACLAWLEDRIDLLKPITDALVGAYEKHITFLADQLKN